MCLYVMYFSSCFWKIFFQKHSSNKQLNKYDFLKMVLEPLGNPQLSDRRIQRSFSLVNIIIHEFDVLLFFWFPYIARKLYSCEKNFLRKSRVIRSPESISIPRTWNLGHLVNQGLEWNNTSSQNDWPLIETAFGFF